MPLFFDNTILLLIPAILLALYAQNKIKSTFNIYSRYYAQNKITGAQLAADILTRNQINDIRIEHVKGSLTDHYDPRKRVLRLSSQVYNSNSIAALGVAAHEAAHVLQHEQSYYPFKLRNAFAPIASIGSQMAFPLLLLGMILAVPSLVEIGVIAFGAAVIFQLITLPVEFNASNKAIEALESGGYLLREEIPPARKVLNAAALTYIAATIMALMQLLRLLFLSGMLGNRRR